MRYLISKKYVLSCLPGVLAMLLSLGVQAQANPADTPTNSFNSYFKKRGGTSIKYSFNPYSSIHDYSGNWDFDGDGISDVLLFRSNGGVHEYWTPVIILSSDRELRQYSWVWLDYPVAGTTGDLKKLLADSFPAAAVYCGRP